MTNNSLDILMRPRSVAVVGASSDVTRIGGRTLRHLRECGFTGEIYPVNPTRDEVQGLKAYQTVAAIPGIVDAAILALPADAVLPAIRDCAQKGVGGVVIFSAGFAEMGEVGAALQAQILDVARQAGMRLLGPNCLGMYNLHAKSFLSFSGVFDEVKGHEGRIGLVSQSGGYAGEVVMAAKELGLYFGNWMTTGNEVDIGLGEAMHYMAQCDDVDVVVGYIEGVRDRDSFFAALETARTRRKPVIVLKVGRTEQGAKAAASHTASLSGADGVYDAVFDRYGVYRARTTEEMLDVAYAASGGRFAAGKRIAILTNSGGIGVQAADFSSDEGLDVAPMNPAVQNIIKGLSPNASAENPVDLTGLVANEPGIYGEAVDAVLATGDFDVAYVNVGLIAGIPFIKQRLLDGLATAAHKHPGLPIVGSITASREIVAEYEAAGFLNFTEPARAIRALAALASFPAAWNRPLGGSDSFADVPVIEAGCSFSEASSKALIAKVSVPSPQEFLVNTPGEAAEAAQAIAMPVALKVVSADILHKTEIGGVALSVDPGDAAERVAKMMDDVAAKAPDAVVEGYLVSPMLSGGVECIVGVHSDPILGPVIMFGLGGVTVELLKDVTTRLAPVTTEEAMQMIRSLRSFPLLDGYRGRAKADVAALVEAVVGISRLAAANARTIKTIEINPLVVREQGQGVIALDAVIETLPVGSL